MLPAAMLIRIYIQDCPDFSNPGIYFQPLNHPHQNPRLHRRRRRYRPLSVFPLNRQFPSFAVLPFPPPLTSFRRSLLRFDRNLLGLCPRDRLFHLFFLFFFCILLFGLSTSCPSGSRSCRPSASLRDSSLRCFGLLEHVRFERLILETFCLMFCQDLRSALSNSILYVLTASNSLSSVSGLLGLLFARACLLALY